ncbi:hypothetical protein D3C79_827390 [compost metagenome]
MAGLVDALGQRGIGGRVQEVAGLVVQALGQARPKFFVQALGCALAALVAFTHERVQAFGEFIGSGGIMVHTNDAQVAVEQAVPAQVVQRRHQQALDQVTVGTEQEQGTRAGCRSGLSGHWPFFSTWPPKPRRMAERTLSP